jgi:hypothetical protein
MRSWQWDDGVYCGRSELDRECFASLAMTEGEWARGGLKILAACLENLDRGGSGAEAVVDVHCHYAGGAA